LRLATTGYYSFPGRDGNRWRAIVIQPAEELHQMTDALGWIATAVFTSSYFFRKPAALRRTQALAASLWIVYGIWIHALPVVIANLLVAAGALYSAARASKTLS
jgi:hypothetical protein